MTHFNVSYDMYLHSIDLSQQLTLGFINTLGFLIRIEGYGLHNSKMQQEDKNNRLAVEQCTTTIRRIPGQPASTSCEC